ncbi:MAG TPA: hypothetical protein VNN18_03035 [Candidatus Xenobia bacterium]|nr:hypothetical protein [Candidatus Xenobia bacterium]
MKKPMSVALLVIIVASLGISAFSQEKGETLREKARKHGSVWTGGYGHAPRDLVNFDDLVTRSNYIIRGRVVDEKTRLSEDERHVVTDYTIEVLEVFKQENGSPSVGERLVVSKRGGNVVVEGHPIRYDTPWSPPVPWLVEHVFFVQRSQSRYRSGPLIFTGFELGIFELGKNKVTCSACERVPHPVMKDLEGKSVREFIQFLKDRVSSLAAANPAREGRQR